MLPPVKGSAGRTCQIGQILFRPDGTGSALRSQPTNAFLGFPSCTGFLQHLFLRRTGGILGSFSRIPRDPFLTNLWQDLFDSFSADKRAKAPLNNIASLSSRKKC